MPQAQYLFPRISLVGHRVFASLSDTVLGWMALKQIKFRPSCWPAGWCILAAACCFGRSAGSCMFVIVAAVALHRHQAQTFGLHCFPLGDPATESVMTTRFRLVWVTRCRPLSCVYFSTDVGSSQEPAVTHCPFTSSQTQHFPSSSPPLSLPSFLVFWVLLLLLHPLPEPPLFHPRCLSLLACSHPPSSFSSLSSVYPVTIIIIIRKPHLLTQTCGREVTEARTSYWGRGRGISHYFPTQHSAFPAQIQMIVCGKCHQLSVFVTFVIWEQQK